MLQLLAKAHRLLCHRLLEHDTLGDPGGAEAGDSAALVPGRHDFQRQARPPTKLVDDALAQYGESRTGRPGIEVAQIRHGWTPVAGYLRFMNRHVPPILRRSLPKQGFRSRAIPTAVALAGSKRALHSPWRKSR